MSLNNAAGTYYPHPSTQSAFSSHVQHLLHLSPEERAIIQARLQAELSELRQRESLYVQKRRELQELESQFRRRMDSRVSVETKYQERADRNQAIIADLKR